MKRFSPFLFVALLTISCGSSSPTSSGSGSFSWSGPIILTDIEATGSTAGLAFTEIGTSNGPVTNAAVTLSFSGGSVGLSYLTSSSYPVTYSGSVTVLSLAYYSNSSFTYTAGQPYTITAAFGGSTYSANTTAVSLPVFSTSSSNLVCNWTGGGNVNVITAMENISPYTTKTFGPNVTSPYTIANSSLPGATGKNNVIASINNLNSSAFSGTSNGSYLLASSQATTYNY
jgi:hypothetical protein